jgi:hypothetical protein
MTTTPEGPRRRIGAGTVSGLLRSPAISTGSLSKLLAALVFFYVAIQLNTHFWLDETAGYWTTNAGFTQIVHRCIIWPHSILYSFVLLALRSLGIHQPWIYRLPSLLAISGACFILFRLTKRLFNSETAWLTLAIFISLSPVQFAAGDARSYALGMLCVIGSTDLLVRLLDRPNLQLALAYGLTAGLVPHFHLLFATVLVFHLCYFITCWFADRRIALSYAVLAVVLVAVVSGPLSYQYLVAAHDVHAHDFSTRPWLNQALLTYFPDACVIALLVTGVFLLLSRTEVKLAIPAGKLPRALAFLWAVVPVALLFAVTSVSPVHVFIPRYLLPFAPGFAICLAALLAALRSPLIPRLFLGVLVALLCLHLRHPLQLSHAQSLGDWADAFAFVDKQTAADHASVLFRSVYPESDVMPLYPLHDNPVFSQLAFYPCTARIIPLARTFDQRQIAQLDGFLASRLNSAPHFFLMFQGLSPAEPLAYFLLGRLGPAWRIRSSDFDGVIVIEFYHTT